MAWAEKWPLRPDSTNNLQTYKTPHTTLFQPIVPVMLAGSPFHPNAPEGERRFPVSTISKLDKIDNGPLAKKGGAKSVSPINSKPASGYRFKTSHFYG
jgi:hypothetical protein